MVSFLFIIAGHFHGYDFMYEALPKHSSAPMLFRLPFPAIIPNGCIEPSGHEGFAISVAASGRTGSS